ncbi:MAG: hypothetical protein K6B74_13085 [Ruminococcus sp.]|nr:hypothetical protein [Ruminococcus sp.]
MRDMSFLTKLGEENEKSKSGSTINGMTAEEYANMLDQKAETGEEEPYFPPQPGSSAAESELPTTTIEDMAAPPTAPKPSADPEKAGGTPKRYSANSYGNSAFMSAAADDRTLKERRLAALKESSEGKIAGFIGAVLGALLGTAIWAAIAWLGYLTWAGAPVVFLSVYLIYLMFARDIGTSGVIVILLLGIAGIFVGNRLCFAVSVFHEFTPAGAVVAVKDKLSEVWSIFLKLGEHLDKYGLRNKYGNNMLIGYFSAAITAGIVFIRRFR